LEEGDGEEEPLLSKGKMRESQPIPEGRGPPIPNTTNDLDDYINWPDDISSDEYPDNHHVQGDKLDHEAEAYSRPDSAEFTTVLGREILEPEQFDSPVEISEIHPDPELKAIMHAEALRYQGLLRAQRIKAYQEASASRPLFIQPSGPKSTPMGIIYLASSQTVDDPMHRGQLNIGIFVAPNYIEQPGLAQAVKEVVDEAFRDTSCHRVRAIVVDHKSKVDTLELYTSRYVLPI
jgi:RimJ/RimL family protein N-acetyltransferase